MINWSRYVFIAPAEISLTIVEFPIGPRWEPPRFPSSGELNSKNVSVPQTIHRFIEIQFSHRYSWLQVHCVFHLLSSSQYVMLVLYHASNCPFYIHVRRILFPCYAKKVRVLFAHRKTIFFSSFFPPRPPRIERSVLSAGVTQVSMTRSSSASEAASPTLPGSPLTRIM